MLKVGINEPLILDKVEVSEKDGKLAVDFSFGGGNAAKAELSPFEMNLNANGFAETGGELGNNIKFWPPKPADPKKYDGTMRTQVEIAQDTLKEVNELHNLLRQFALCYVTSDKVNLSNYMRETGCDKDNWHTTFPNQSVLDKVTRNLVADFNAAVEGHLGVNDADHQLRVICIRQNKSTYATFRQRFIADNPIVENALVPIESTKLKFTAKEIEKGLNSPTVPKVTTDPTPESDIDAGVFDQSQ